MVVGCLAEGKSCSLFPLAEQRTNDIGFQLGSSAADSNTARLRRLFAAALVLKPPILILLQVSLTHEFQ